MTETEQNNLFQRYGVIKDTVFQKHGGSGLGLSISKDLVTLMGGSMSVKSEPGKGNDRMV